jgi:hypothetical protein
MENLVEHWLVFSYDSSANEYVPQILGWGHGLKQENLVRCTSMIEVNNDSYYVVKKNTEFKNKKIEITLTFNKCESDTKEGHKAGEYYLSQGTLYSDGKSFNVLQYCGYYSLQIGEFCYDNIYVIRLSRDFLEFISE